MSEWALGPLGVSLSDFGQMTLSDFRALMRGHDLKETHRKQQAIFDAACFSILLTAEDFEQAQRDLYASLQPLDLYTREAEKAGLHPPKGQADE